MLMRLMSKGEYLIVPKGTKFTGAGKLGLREPSSQANEGSLPRGCDYFAHSFHKQLSVLFCYQYNI